MNDEIPVEWVKVSDEDHEAARYHNKTVPKADNAPVTGEWWKGVAVIAAYGTEFLKTANEYSICARKLTGPLKRDYHWDIDANTDKYAGKPLLLIAHKDNVSKGAIVAKVPWETFLRLRKPVPAGQSIQDGQFGFRPRYRLYIGEVLDAQKEDA